MNVYHNGCYLFYLEKDNKKVSEFVMKKSS